MLRTFKTAVVVTALVILGIVIWILVSLGDTGTAAGMRTPVLMLAALNLVLLGLLVVTIRLRRRQNAHQNGD